MEAYLDNAATTKIKPAIAKAIADCFSGDGLYGNPSSQHDLGWRAREGIESARAAVAKSINAEPEEIYFTSGGTESNNIAIQGFARREAGLIGSLHKYATIHYSSIEHKSVINACESAPCVGRASIPVDRRGIVDLGALGSYLRTGAALGNAALVSVMLANNEIGTIEPIEEIDKLRKSYGRGQRMVLHTDATQAYGKMPIDVKKLGVDMLTASGHKVGAPKGIGFLYIRNGIKISPLMYGGGQESGIRPGTENVPYIIGLGVAASGIEEETAKYGEVEKLSLYFADRFSSAFGDGISFNGCGENILKLPHIINVSFKGVDGQSLLEALNGHHIYASAGSACNASSPEVSHVLKAIRLNDNEARSAIRFSLGNSTTKEEIDYTVGVLEAVLPLLKTV